MVRNITLSADPVLIEQARQKARKERRTLNIVFREWLQRYIGQGRERDYATLMKKMRYARPGRVFSRDEMNAR